MRSAAVDNGGHVYGVCVRVYVCLSQSSQQPLSKQADGTVPFYRWSNGGTQGT